MSKDSFLLTQEMCVHVGIYAFMHVNCWGMFKHLYQQNADLPTFIGTFSEIVTREPDFFMLIFYTLIMCYTFQVCDIRNPGGGGGGVMGGVEATWSIA